MSCCELPSQKANTIKNWLESGTITGTTNKRRFVYVHSICASVGLQFCNVLPAMHSLTGCDSVSSLFEIGKKTVFNVVTQKEVDHFVALPTLGTSNKEAALSAAIAFTAMLYDPRDTEKNAHSSLNGLRLKLVNKKDRSLRNCPHVKQVLRNMQCTLSGKRRCDQAKHWIPTGVWVGKKVENLYLSTSKVQWRQSSWKVSSAHAPENVAAQTTVHAVRT